MKAFKALLAVLATIIIAGNFSACKKHVDPKTACRITTLSSSSGLIKVEYNAEGKISTLTNGTDTNFYTYSSNATTMEAHSSGLFAYRIIATTNADGLATNVRQHNNASGTNWTNTAYEYNGVEVSKETHTTSGAGTPPWIVTYTWIDHNLASSTTGGVTTTWSYYLDKPQQKGDYVFFTSFQGYEIYRPKNLVKSVGTATLQYGFNNDGLINSMTINIPNSAPQTVSYNYDCSF
jgi:hypothetical protein